ncbi:MAG: hypothetical protein LBU99_04570 [Spirochaetaceae bacterium]|jgi:hypothetical protein|nr:hypothetical protein [Spirochaetaceae bacterium]
MPDVCLPNQSIEGKKITGTSRKPIQFIKKYKRNDRILYEFKVSFDVKSSIEEMLDFDNQKIRDNAYTQRDNTIVCKNAVIQSLKQKCSTEKGSNISATHSAFVWKYPQQTNVMVITAHEEIQNAINKRKELTQGGQPLL